MPWRRDGPPTAVFWPGEFHGPYSPWVRKESDTTERLSLALAPEMTTLKGVNKADRWGPLSSPFSLRGEAPSHPLSEHLSLPYPVQSLSQELPLGNIWQVPNMFEIGLLTTTYIQRLL